LRRSAEETPQRGQVHPVLLEVLAFRSFQDFRHFGETTIIHETAEGLETDEPLADVHVAVDTAPELLLAIVHVKNPHPLGADETVELPDGLLIARLGSNIVARGEEMAGIQADTDALLVASLFDHCRQVLKPVPEATS